MFSVDLTAEERRTRELFAAREFNSEEACVGLVFRAMHTSALTADQICVIAKAMRPCIVEFDVQKALKRLCRAKVLRSRVSSGGLKLYEVNY